MTIRLQKTRFVCVSDTHNASPVDGVFKLPKGDVFIHAGDLTKQGTLAELRKTLAWIEDADFEVKLVIAGNHDITLDQAFYAEHSQYFHNQYPQNSQACVDLIKEYHSITFLNHESVEIRLTKENGPRTSFRVFGSPWSPANGLWAFGYPPERASVIWDGCIPLNTDIVISHTPPKYHCDESRNRGPAGCEALRQKLWRVRPSLAICGHVHEGRGVERVLWDLETPNVKYKETATGYWTDAGLDSKKQSLVDLSAKSRVPLDNTDNWDDTYPTTGNALLNMSIMEPSQPWRLDYSSSYQHDNESHSAVWGQGGTPPPGRCDVEALEGRMGRRETCVVNASIMTSSWPYKSKNQRRYNKPIVVDIDLPVRPHEGQNPSTDLPTESDHSFLSENGTMSDEAVYSSLSS